MTKIWAVYRDDGENTAFYPEHFCADEKTAKRLVEEEHRERYNDWVKNSVEFNKKKEALLVKAQEIAPDITLEQVRQIGVAFGMVGPYASFFVDIISFEEWNKTTGIYYSTYRMEELK